jgi:hypothetical protein
MGEIVNACGLNIRPNFDKATVRDYLREANPAVNLMEIISANDLPAVLEVRGWMSAGSTLVVRVKEGEDGAYWDAVDNPQHYIPPEVLIQKYQAFGKGSLVLQVLNEPDTGGDLNRIARLCDYLIKCADEADRLGVRLALGAWASHNPSRNRQLTWEGYEPLFKRVGGSKHLLAIHAYRRLDGATLQPMPLEWCDAITPALALFDRLGLPPAQFVILETGNEVGGGQGDDGWSGPKWRRSGAEYIRDLNDAHETLWAKYVQSGVLLGWCIFAVSAGNQWASFDITRILGEIRLKIINEFYFIETVRRVVTPPPVLPTQPPMPPLGKVKLTVPDGARLRFRSPSIGSNPVALLVTGSELTIIGTQYEQSSNSWWCNATFGSLTGWFNDLGGRVQFQQQAETKQAYITIGPLTVGTPITVEAVLKMLNEATVRYQ